MADDTIKTRKRRMIETWNSLSHALQGIWIISMSLFLICAMIFGILLMYFVYQKIYELIFYRNREWNFDIKNKFARSMFDGDSNDPAFFQGNRKRVMFGVRMMIISTFIVFFGSVYIGLYQI
ncbi:hypothetical protein ACO34A_27010 (plasmid) [Rhizobium sp. ACO-34A]|nr:hypothetical protein ACO34A_27010 [Rhizobium sp. ACO-34A]